VGRERECELECMGTVNCIPSIFARLGQLWQYLVVETRLIRGNRGHRPSRGGRRGGSAPPAPSRACHVRCTECRRLNVYSNTSILSVTRLVPLTRHPTCRSRRSMQRLIASSPARPILGPARHVTSVVPSLDFGYTLSARLFPSLGSIVSACTTTDAAI
jgi:hypothetical protein